MCRNKAGRLTALCLSGVLLLAGLLAGCGRSSRTAESSDGYEKYVAEEIYETGDYEADEAALESAAEASGGAFSGVGALRVPESETEKLIYSGSITLQTLDYEKTMQSIHARISEAGGFVQYEDESDGNDHWYYGQTSYASRYATIQARIPSKQFQSFMEELQEDGQVMNHHVNVDNISQTYNETEASVKAYEIEQERLLGMMDKAETIEDMIAVEARLSEVEAELGRYKTALDSMDRDVEYSTVSISVDEVREYTEEPDDSTFLSRLKETVASSWSGFLWFMEGLLHVIIRLIPFLAVIAVVVLIVRTIARKTEDRRLVRRAERAKKKAEKSRQRAQRRQQKAMLKYGGAPEMPPQGVMPPQESTASQETALPEDSVKESAETGKK